MFNACGRRSFVRTKLAPSLAAIPFQADDEGSIPFTRSNFLVKRAFSDPSQLSLAAAVE
jgi:hypothetical protein